MNKDSSFFNINKNDWVEIVNLSRGRRGWCDEIEYLEKNKGNEYLIKSLKTDINNGIKSNSINERIKNFGSNKKEKTKLKGFWSFLWEALKDFLLRILLLCGVVVIIINYTVKKEDYSIAWIDGTAILFAVLLSSSVTALNDYKKEIKFKELKEDAEKNKFVTVIRDGKRFEKEFDDIVVGDLIKINSGIELPADGYLVEGIDVKCDESAMTGETKPLKKNTLNECIKIRDLAYKNNSNKNSLIPSPILISGTKVLDGVGLFIVIAVGKNSQIGKIKIQIEEGLEELTPLQLKLEKIAKNIGYFGLVSAIIIFVIVLIRSIIDFFIHSKSVPTGGDLFVKIVLGIVIAITVLVVAIPEGLPLAVTISLAYSIKKMMKDNNLVRKLQACETMGGANIICSDKTGTLTKNEMYLTHFWNFKNNIIYDSKNSTALKLNTFTNETTSKTLYNAIIYNSLDDPNFKKGNPTELAILKYFHLLGKNIVEDRNKIKKIYLGAFNSNRKRMSTIINIDGKIYSFMKGASELMLKESNQILNLRDNKISDINDKLRLDIENAINEMANSSLRTIGILMKELKEIPNFEEKDERGIYNYEKDNYIFLGICGIKDIIRPEVPLSIKKCKEAGIQVKMVTGDNKITARAIATEVGIIEKNDKNSLVLEGPEFIEMIGGLVCENCINKNSCDCVENINKLEEPKNKGKKVKKLIIKNKKKFKEISKDLKVLARSRPDDKLTLVTGLKELENVVAVTGDGTNDAPALSKANVGFAMNIAGTQIAKDASDILILDDNFKSIVEAVKWGRNIYDNIRKFLQFQLTVNIVAVIVTMLSASINNVSIFSPAQMLWINLIMDTFASLALATEPPNDELLKRKPHKKKDNIINRKMLKHITGQVIYQMIIILLILYAGPYFLPANRESARRTGTIFIKKGGELIDDKPGDNNPSEHFTYNFNTFVMLQVFNFINARKLNDEFNNFKGIKKSPLFILMVLIIIILQIIFLTFAGRGMGVIQWGLNYYQWFICIGFGAICLIVNLILKLIPEDKFILNIFRKKKKKIKKNKKNNNQLDLNLIEN